MAVPIGATTDPIVVDAPVLWKHQGEGHFFLVIAVSQARL
jgi:hypothetical protein